MQSMQEEEQVYNASPVNIAAYDMKSHKSKEILRCIFKSLSNQDEKLSFTVLKLIDALLGKNIPEIHDKLFMDSI